MANNTYKKPFYEIEIKAFMCSFEIKINGIPTFFSYENQQIATDWPINMFIIKNGKQEIDYQILPLYENGILAKEAHLELNIYVREADDLYLKKEKINQFIFNSDIEIKNTVNHSYFNAEVPFELSNYLENSIHLTEFNYEKLKDELWVQYEKMFDIISSRNVNNYNDLTDDRFSDMQKAFYLDEIKKKYYTQNPFGIFKEFKLNNALKNEYHLEIYGNGYLCSLQLKNRTPGLCIYTLENDIITDIVIESAIFYMDEDQNYILYR